MCVSAGPEHPGDLLRADLPYLAPWGRRDVRRAAWICGSLTAIAAVLSALLSPWCAVALGPILGLWAFLVLFFRNPRRSVPREAGLWVAPADGTVWDIEEVEEPEFLQARALRIGIFLSVFDVHVNRAPCSGRVAWRRYYEGHYHDARSEKAARENEALAVGLVRSEGLGGEGTPILLRMISGAIARRICCPLEVGQPVARGGLIGMIKYGSRTELWIPLDAGFEPRVRVGDKVRGGETIVGISSSAVRGAHEQESVETA